MFRLIFRVFFVGLLILSPFLLKGLDPETPIDGYQLADWSKGSRLPGHSVYNILQTPDGFMWLECSGGVVRYDGQKFIPIGKVDFAGKPVDAKDFFRTLLVEDNGTLWLLKNCRSPVLYRDGRLEPPVYLDSKTRIPADAWIGMKDSFGDVWLGTYGSTLYCLRNGRLIEYGPGKGFPGEGVSSMIEDKCGQLWVSSRNHGVFKLKGGRFSPVPIAGFDSTTLTNWLYEDRGGVIWIGTNKGLFLKKNGHQTHLTTRDGLSHNAVVDIIEDSDGNIWVGTKNGLNRVRKYASGEIRIDSCLSCHIINVIFEDEEKNIWIGTEGQGLKRLRDAAFHVVDFGKGFSHGINCLHQTAGGVTWIGTQSGDLLRTENEKIVETFHLNDQINGLADDRDGNLWIGTDELGLFCLSPGKRIRHYEKELKNNHITSMYCDSRGRLWIGSTGGITVYRDGVFKSFEKGEGLPTGFIFFFREDRRHNLWIGSQGLFLLEKGETGPGQVTNVLEKSVENYSISCMFFDDDDSLWVGTPCGIILRKRDGKWARFGRKIYYRSNMNAAINHIFKDDAGYFWLSTIDGILRINPKRFDDLAEGKLEWLLPREYGPCDGLRCGECTAITYHSVISPRKGEYWFATKKGVAVLRTDKVRFNKAPPRVVIEKIKVDGKDTPMPGSEYSFKDAAHLRFYFTAATLTSQEGVYFKYKLAGRDKDWSLLPPGKERTAEYWNLPPGRYSFSVNACNNDGLWSQQGAAFTFSIPAAFFSTPLNKGFLLLGILALFGTGYFFFQKSLQKVREEALQSAAPENGKDAGCLLKLNELLEQEKIYRDDGISLESLSRRMNVSARHLSQLINEKLKKSFFDLINFYRVEDAKQLLSAEEKEQRNILDIAFEVGFNTKSAFNRAFKKHTGTTPSQFRESIKG